MKIALLGTLVGNSLTTSLSATENIGGINFDRLTQPRLFKGEEFLEIEKQKLAPTSPPAEFFLKYFKLWPISFISPSSDIKTQEYTQNLQGIFYTECLPTLKNKKFQEAKTCLALAHSIKPYEESVFKSFIQRAERCLKNLMLKDASKINEEVDAEILYWAWKHRELFPSLFTLIEDWQDVLTLAANHTKPSARAQYALGRFLEEQGNKDAQSSFKQQTLEWYQKSAGNGYQKAQLYLDYIEAKNNGILNLIEFYKRLAKLTKSNYPQYPYAQYIVGKRLLSEQGDELINASNEVVQEGFAYLQNAARYGIKEAQKKLNEIRSKNKDLFYTLCNLSDRCEGDQKRLEFLREKAEKNLAPYAYQLAQMYEDGRGVPFSNLQEWLKALEEAKRWYEMSRFYKAEESTQEVQRVQAKIDSTEAMKGYILNKIMKSATVSFSPHHPLFEEFSNFINALHKFSPSTRYLGTIIIQQLLETPPSPQNTKKVIEELLGIIQSEGAKWQLKEDEPEAEQAAELLRIIISKSQTPTSSAEKPTSELSQFLVNSESFIIRKIKGSIASFSPHHPLYEDFSTFINMVSRYEGSVPEHGAHLVQQLLHFPSQSHQAKVLITNLIDLLKSAKFQYGEEGDSKEEIDDYRVEKLARLNQAIEFTRIPCRLLSPLKKEEEGGVPEKVKVTKAMFRDPRVQVFNNYFDREEKTPFDRHEFDQAVEAILRIYDRLYEQSKITQDLLLDQDKKSTTYKQYGNREKLYDLLTNKEGFGNKVPNRFGHRLIKIRSILEDGTFEEDRLVNLLSLWAVAGLSCAIRSEGETHRFYNMSITKGRSQENENDTLEVKVALSLANLRRQLLHKVVKEDEVEPLHKFNYLEKKHGAKLGLTDPQNAQDSNEGIIPAYCRNLTTSTIQHAMWNGDPTYRINIEPGKGYGNPTILIEHLVTIINKEKSDIPLKVIRKRFKDQYKQDWRAYFREYYNEDGPITKEGAKALLYSLGYLEKDLGPKIQQVVRRDKSLPGVNPWSHSKQAEPSHTQGSTFNSSITRYDKGKELAE